MQRTFWPALRRLGLAGVLACGCASAQGDEPGKAAAPVRSPAQVARCDSLRAASIIDGKLQVVPGLVPLIHPRAVPGNRDPRPVYDGDQPLRGTVRLVVHVDTLGRVVSGSIRTLRSEHARLTLAVQRVVAQWRFRPALLEPGCTVAMDVHISFTF